MLKFSQYLKESPSEFMSFGGARAARHAFNYVRPYIGNDQSMLEIGKDHEGLQAGTKARALSQKVIDGKHYTEMMPENGQQSTLVPNSKIKKPPELIKKRGDRGFKAETVLADVLKSEGLMKKGAASAGSTHGLDFHILTPGGEQVGGEERPNLNHEIGGESKVDLGAKFGSVFLSHTPEKGWHVSDKNRQKKPNFAQAVERATVNVNGKSKPLLQHLNDTWGDPSGGQHLKNVTSETTDDAPAQAYFRDHGAHILHVHTHGTYRVGDSHEDDSYNTKLPTISGMTGRFTVGRERKGGGVQISFRPHKGSLKKSDTDIMDQDQRNQFAQNIKNAPPRQPPQIQPPQQPVQNSGRSLSINTGNISGQPKEPAPEPAPAPPPIPVKRSRNSMMSQEW